MLLRYYYHFKPLIPRRVQIEVRRRLMLRKLKAAVSHWPINKDIGNPPEGWTGWPEGKRFALVLTHDVEGPRGVEKCPLLAGLEKSYGFRSSFNFVCEDYSVPQDLFANLRDEGFEIGVHGLNHHGNPFRSRKVFDEQSRKINTYLQKFGAVGFRSPSMYHNLDWISELKVEYDASTFDVDPFEPQPDGVNTIFPFIVSTFGNDRSYVELPYTLVQDSTLFIFLGKENIDLWKKKLDWIADKGGMALLITHPDYMNFDRKKKKHDEYPVDLYKEFLEYIQSKYGGQYWHILPKQIASFWKNNNFVNKHVINVKDQKSKINVCMLTYSFYTVDARVRRYAEILAQRGDHVDVLSLGEDDEKNYEVLNSVHIYRIQKRSKNEKNKFDYIYRVLKFLINSTYRLTKNHIKTPYDLIHVHSIPDFEVFAAMLPKLSGAKIILDIHDPVPDFFLAKFGSNNMCYYNILSFLERISTRFSHHVITVTDYWMEKIAKRSSIPKAKISVTLNLPDTKMFNYKAYEKEKKKSSDFILIYPGTINKHCGLDFAIKALSMIRGDIQCLKFYIYGTGTELKNLQLLVKELKLEDMVFFHSFVPLDSVPEIMRNADAGIALLAGHDDYAQQALNVKLFEYLSMGLPTIATRTKSIEYYLDDNAALLSEPNSINDIARCLKELYTNDEKRQELRQKGLEFIEKNNSELQMNHYLDIVNKLTVR